MKTTKIGLVLIAFLILMTSVLAAAPMPYPIAGKITIVGDLVPMFEVELSTCDIGSDLNHCEIESINKFSTDSTGSYIFALDDINPMYMARRCNSKGVCYNGDFVMIKVCDNHPNCEIIKEVTGSAMIVNFDLGLDKTVEIVKEVEKIVEVPIKNDKGEDIPVVIADEKTTLERMVASKSLPWIVGFTALVLFFMGTQWGRAKKMYASFIKKNNQKGYGK